MTAPYRLSRPAPTLALEGANAIAEDAEGAIATAGIAVPKQGAVVMFQSYLDRLIKMIPAEVIGLYLVGKGIIDTQASANRIIPLIVWTLVCLIAVVTMRIFGTNDPTAKHPIDWPHVVISAIAFLIWVYTIGGGPFPQFYVSYIGSLLVLVWTFFVPMFYHGAD